MQISIKAAIIVIVLVISMVIGAHAETIYLPIVNGRDGLVHAFTYGRGLILRAGDSVEIHCEYSNAVARVDEWNAIVDCVPIEME